MILAMFAEMIDSLLARGGEPDLLTIDHWKMRALCEAYGWTAPPARLLGCRVVIVPYIYNAVTPTWETRHASDRHYLGRTG